MTLFKLRDNSVRARTRDDLFHTGDFLICKFTIKWGKPVTQLPYLCLSNIYPSTQIFIFLFLINRAYFSSVYIKWVSRLYSYVGKKRETKHTRDINMTEDVSQFRSFQSFIYVCYMPDFVK